MDTEKSSNSSFEDLSNLNEGDMKAASQALLEKEAAAAAAMVLPEIGDKAGKSTPDVSAAEETVIAGKESVEGDHSSEGDNESCDILGNGQLVKRILNKSKSGKRPTRGDLVTITYTGKLVSGLVVENEEEYQLHVGDFEVSRDLYD